MDFLLETAISAFFLAGILAWLLSLFVAYFGGSRPLTAFIVATLIALLTVWLVRRWLLRQPDKSSSTSGSSTMISLSSYSSSMVGLVPMITFQLLNKADRPKYVPWIAVWLVSGAALPAGRVPAQLCPSVSRALH